MLKTQILVLRECVCEIFVVIVVTPYERAIESPSLRLSNARSIMLTSVVVRELLALKVDLRNHFKGDQNQENLKVLQISDF